MSKGWKTRGGLTAGIVAVMLGVMALLPGTFSTALAQTTPIPGESTSTTTDPTTGTTTTVTTSPTGVTTTVTTRTDGTTSTVTEQPTGEKTTVVVVPNQGTVTVVEAPGQPVAVTVAPANPNTDTTMQLDVLGAQLSVPGGTLSPGEVIAIVEQSFNVAIVLGITREDAPAANGDTVQGAQNFVDLQGVQGFANEPGSIQAVRVFEMTVQRSDGSTGQIAKPILFTWDFTPEDLAAAGGDIANLLMLGQDEVTQKWSPVPQVSSTATSVTFEVPHFSLWAFAVRTPGGTVPAPANTGILATPEADRTGTYALFAGTALAALALGGLGLRFARRRA
ncbi:MAG: hypothetical protein AMXMBFR23_19170 [Chloroflexota bacterium]